MHEWAKATKLALHWAPCVCFSFLSLFVLNPGDGFFRRLHTETEGDLGHDNHAASSITIHLSDACINRFRPRLTGENVTHFLTPVKTWRKKRIARDEDLSRCVWWMFSKNRNAFKFLQVKWNNPYFCTVFPAHNLYLVPQSDWNSFDKGSHTTPQGVGGSDALTHTFTHSKQYIHKKIRNEWRLNRIVKREMIQGSPTTKERKA